MGGDLIRPVCQDSSSFCFCGTKLTTPNLLYMFDTSDPTYNQTTIQLGEPPIFNMVDDIFDLVLSIANSSFF